VSDTVPAIDARRRQSGAFLRSRRERLTPSAVGLPNGIRRRTPGLRREEVAMLAGVGATWYTWLEQGRDVRPSAEVLSALADALRLDPAERRHLYVLNDRPPPESRPVGPERVEQPLRRMLDSLAGQPAYVLGRRWDVLAWNEAAAAVFGDYERLRGDERNIMYLVFADKAHRRLLVDWETLAPTSLAMFRADCARYAGDPDFERLVATLMQVSPEFRQWWPQQEVLRPLAGHKRIKHPSAGRMTFEYTSFAVADQVDMKLIVYTPLDADRTAEKLEGLLHDSVTNGRIRRVVQATEQSSAPGTVAAGRCRADPGGSTLTPASRA
jgi:transcriptional regulator with XRE-family HTH domain